MHTYSISVVNLYQQPPNSMERYRVMVIGNNVTTVQRVSRYCLEQGVEVFPYYGIPTDEEVTLFAPNVSVLCLPVPDDFQPQTGQPCILWSEKPLYTWLPLVSTPTELEARLQELLQA